MSAELYDRVECNEEKGTIFFIGKIPPTSDLWYGIDWDNEERGKHNGTHNGAKYFNTRSEKSGSFLRPTKVNVGISLEDGIKGRYQDDPAIENHLTDQLQKSIKARFVEVVGMEKVGEQQSQIDKLETVVLDGWLIRGPCLSDLGSLFPRIKDLDLSNTLLSSWEDVANICQQLGSLKFINISNNRLIMPNNPSSLIDSFSRISHLIINSIFDYTWDNLLTCAAMFENLKILQLAFNKLEKFTTLPDGLFEHLEHLDIGANPISDPCEVLKLGKIKGLSYLNLNNCQLPYIMFPDTPPGEKTDLFPSLSSLSIANNPIDIWKTVGELDKVWCLKELNLTHEEGKPGCDDYVLEHTFARIRSIELFNRTRASSREKRDHQLFYLRFFSGEFYSSGGDEDISKINLTSEFMEKHPTYLAIVKALGVPSDEREQNSQRCKSIRDLKMSLKILITNNESIKQLTKTFVPTIRISKVKMMLKRQLAVDPNARLKLSYRPESMKNKPSFEIEMDNDMHNLQYYSISDGDTLVVRW